MIPRITQVFLTLSIIFLGAMLVFGQPGHMIAEAFMEMRHSPLTGKSYGIHDHLPDHHKTANIMGRLDQFIERLTGYVQKADPADPRTIRLLERLVDTRIEEAPWEHGTSSYTLNKGELIAFCVRDKEDKDFHDHNTLMFVVIHELAHVASISKGHNQEFMDNFQWLLKHARASGLYQPVDYSKKPITYCGVRVTNNPLFG